MLTELNNHKTSFFICPKDSCTGCTACMNVCSHAAISFIPDEEGFLHPSVDKGRCVNCGLCKSVCPVNTPVSRYLPEEVYSGGAMTDRCVFAVRPAAHFLLLQYRY